MANEVANRFRTNVPITAKARCVSPVKRVAITRAIEAPSALYKFDTGFDAYEW